jgi:hypothetical protein
MGRPVISLCAVFGTIAGGFVPALWGDSGISLAGLLCAGLGGVAGVWVGVRLSE